MSCQQHRDDFQRLLQAGSRELYQDNPNMMNSAKLLPTPNEIADDDLRLFFMGLQKHAIEIKRGARFNTLDRPTKNGHWGLLSRSKQGGWYNAEYLPQIAAYVQAIYELGYPQERVFFELPDRGLKLDLAIVDDANKVVVLGEAKRSLAMLEPLLNDVSQKYGQRNPGPEGRNEARQLAWRLWTSRAPFLWLIGPGERRAYEASYNPLRLTHIPGLPSARELKLNSVPAVRLVIPDLLRKK